MNIYLTGIFVAVVFSVGAADLPCAARDGAPGEGKICVCNSTYCDTIEQPRQLDRAQFHYYKTSASSPGFTHSILQFSRQSLNSLSDDEVVFTIDPSETFQEYIGFGGSISDTVGLMYDSLSPEAQDKFMRSYFGPSGLEYSFIRVPIGGSDFSVRQYTLDDVPFDEDLSHFSLAAEDYKYRIPMIKTAISLSERQIRITACTWSSPAWMKTQEDNFAGYIKEKYHALWAQYHVKFLEAYQENGLDVWSLSGGNEPLLMFVLAFAPGMMNCTFTNPDNQAQWFKNHLKPQLVASNFTEVKLLAMEDQAMFSLYWMDAFRIDPEALAAIDGLGVHWYSDWNTPAELYIAKAELMHRTYPDKMMLYTEGSINEGFGPDPVVLGSWFRASGYIIRLFMILDNWNVGFIDWNLALNPDGGPTYTFGIDGPIIVNTTSDEFYKQPIFYVLGHFSKFIHPGSVKLKVTSNQNDTESQNMEQNTNFADVVQSFRKDRLNEAPIPLPVDIPQVVRCLTSANPDGSVSVIVMNLKNSTVPVRVDDTRVGSIVMDVEENSMNSFVYWP